MKCLGPGDITLAILVKNRVPYFTDAVHLSSSFALPVALGGMPLLTCVMSYFLATASYIWGIYLALKETSYWWPMPT